MTDGPWTVAMVLTAIDLLCSYVLWRKTRRLVAEARMDLAAACFMRSGVQSMLLALNKRVQELREENKRVEADEADWWKKGDGRD